MKSILIIIDIQNGFARYEQTKDLGEKVVKLSNSGFFDTVIATRFINNEGSPYTEFLNWHRLMASPEIDLVDGLKADIVVDKPIYTCVNEEFIKLLQEQNNGQKPRAVFVCGADTDCCVLTIANDLFQNGIKPLVLLNYCNSNGGPQSHQAGKLAMQRLIGNNSLIEGENTSKEDIIKILNEQA